MLTYQAPFQYKNNFVKMISILVQVLTHWRWVTHICIGNPTTIGPNNGLWPGWCQAILWTNAGVLLIEPFGTNFSEILIEINTFSFKKMHLKTSGKWRAFCLGLNVLNKLMPWPWSTKTFQQPSSFFLYFFFKLQQPGLLCNEDLYKGADVWQHHQTLVG